MGKQIGLEGVFVYAFTERGHKLTGEPPHWLCRVCVANEKKSILSVLDGEWFCDICNNGPGLGAELCPEFAIEPERQVVY